MHHLEYLQYIGVTLVQSVKTLPGAAPCDDYLISFNSSQPLDHPIENKQKLIHATKKTGEYEPRVPLENKTSISDIVDNTHTFKPIENSDTQKVITPSFHIWLCYHPQLKILILVEISEGSSSQKELSALLNNILLALSNRKKDVDHQLWNKKLFKWPLNVGVDSQLSSAQQVFESYITCMEQPDTLLVFNNVYLKQLLYLDVKDHNHIIDAELKKFWDKTKVKLSPELNRYLHDTSLKKYLWGIIKSLY
jgi:hypothetical protein